MQLLVGGDVFSLRPGHDHSRGPASYPQLPRQRHHRLRSVRTWYEILLVRPDDVMTSRGVVMTSRGVVMKSRGVVMTSNGFRVAARLKGFYLRFLPIHIAKVLTSHYSR